MNLKRNQIKQSSELLSCELNARNETDLLICLCVSLCSVGCPLLLFWPLVCEVRGSRGGRACGDEGEDAVMEMRLRENPQQFSSALLQLSTRYLFILGAQVGPHAIKCSLCTDLHINQSSICLFGHHLKHLVQFRDLRPLQCDVYCIVYFFCLPCVSLQSVSVPHLFTGLCFGLCSCYPQETPNGVEGFRTQVSA